MRVTIYNSDPEWVDVAAAVAVGFQARGDEIEVGDLDAYEKPNEWTQMACFFGLRHSGVYTDHNRAGKHTLLIEKGYLAPETHYRFALDGFQSRFLHGNKTPRPVERLHELLASHGLILQPMRKVAGSLSVLYAGSGQGYCHWHRLGKMVEYDVGACTNIIASNNVKCSIQYRAEEPVDDPLYWHPRRTTVRQGVNYSIETLLRSTNLFATHGHPGAVTAMVLGYPVLALSEPLVLPIYPLCESNIRRIATPYMPNDEDRLRILSNVAHAEYSLEEISQGLAIDYLTPHCVKRFEKHGGDPNDLQFIIEQYRLMHEHPKRYRGGLAEEHVVEIQKLVRRHKTRSLLDYGSGKGRQYEEYKQHLEWGGPKPDCYDPGYPPLAKKPDRKYDGVICTDVAEHLPEDKVEWFLNDVIDYAQRFVFLVIFTGPAIKMLPDGRNCHLTIRPEEWWLDRLGFTLAKRSGVVDVYTNDLPKHSYRLTAGDLEVVVVFKLKE